MKKIDQKGFTTVKILIIAVVVMLVVGVFWYLLASKKNTAQDQNQDQTQNDNQRDPEGTTYFTFNEQKVQMPINDKLKDLKISQEKASVYNADDRASVIAAPVLDEGWKCKQTSKTYKGIIGYVTITKQKKRSGPSEPTLTKKIGDYTFGFEQAGESCTDNAVYKEYVAAFKSQFQKLKTY